MLHQPELAGATERFLIDADRGEWQPLAPGALDAVAAVFDRLGDDAAIMRQAVRGRGHVVTVSGRRAGVSMAGQGSTVGEALRDLRAVLA